MYRLRRCLLVFGLTLAASMASGNLQAANEPQERITILYDAFGKDPSMQKDWASSALVEVARKRIRFPRLRLDQLSRLFQTTRGLIGHHVAAC